MLTNNVVNFKQPASDQKDLYRNILSIFVLFSRWCNAARINELKFSNSMQILKTMYERQLQGDQNFDGSSQ